MRVGAGEREREQIADTTSSQRLLQTVLRMLSIMAAASSLRLESQNRGAATGASSDCDAPPESAARPAAATAPAGPGRPSLERDTSGADGSEGSCVQNASSCAGENLVQALQANMDLDDTDLEKIERSLLTVREL